MNTLKAGYSLIFASLVLGMNTQANGLLGEVTDIEVQPVVKQVLVHGSYYNVNPDNMKQSYSPSGTELTASDINRLNRQNPTASGYRSGNAHKEYRAVNYWDQQEEQLTAEQINLLNIQNPTASGPEETIDRSDKSEYHRGYRAINYWDHISK